MTEVTHILATPNGSGGLNTLSGGATAFGAAAGMESLIVLSPQHQLTKRSSQKVLEAVGSSWCVSKLLFLPPSPLCVCGHKRLVGTDPTALFSELRLHLLHYYPASWLEVVQ